MSNQARGAVLAARVSSETKAQFSAIAHQRGLSESNLLKSLVSALIARETSTQTPDGMEARASPGGRITLRLRRGDGLLVSALASARRMKPSSYLVMLIHAHVRRFGLLGPADVDDLKRAVSALGLVGQALRTGPADTQPDVSAALLLATQACVDDLRREVSDFVQRQLICWESGDE